MSAEQERTRPSSRRADEAADRSAVLVAGMHRSGTSALTRIISLLGADLPRDLMPPRESNEAGHWEPAQVVMLHEEILRSASSSWDDLSPFPRSWYGSPHETPFRRRLLDILADDYGDSPFFVVKDPRICRLIPFWVTALQEARISPSFVLTLRNPLEVAASLKERDELSVAHGLMLWLRHMLEAERDTRGHPRVVVSYHDLLRDWESQALAVSERLGIPWPSLGHNARAQIDRFLASTHRHFSVSDQELARHAAVVDWVRSAYTEFKRSADSHEAPSAETLDQLLAELDRADLAFGPILGEVGAKASELERELVDRSSEAVALDRALTESQLHLKERREQAARMQAGLESRQRLLDEAIAERKRIVAALVARKADVASRTAELAERDERIAQLDEEIAGAQAELAATKRELEARDQEVDRDRAQRAETVSELEALKTDVAGLAEDVSDTKRRAAAVRSQTAAQYLDARRAGRWRSARQMLVWIVRGRLGRIRTYRALKKSGEFDATVYLIQNSDVLESRLNPLMHFVAGGARDGRDPNERFSVHEYLAKHPELVETGENPLLHSLRHPVDESPAPAGAPEPPEQADGRKPRRRPLRRRRWVKLLAWALRGKLRLLRTDRALRRSGRFDADYYLSRYPDIAEAGFDPLMHYVEYGAREGRDPSPDFTTLSYLIRRPELEASGENPLLHSLRIKADAKTDAEAVPAPPRKPAEVASAGRRADSKTRSVARRIVEAGGRPLVLAAGGPAPQIKDANRFPAAPDGSDPGISGGTSAIANLEALRSAGHTHLVIPPGADPWLGERPAFRRHVANRYRKVTGEGGFAVHSLEPSPVIPWGQAFDEMLEGHRWRYHDAPSILDWTPTLRLPGRVRNAAAFAPTSSSEGLPYIDGSVGIVVLDAERTDRMLSEARRVARDGVVVVDTGGAERSPLSVEWLRDGDVPRTTVSIVIPTYNGASLVDTCLRSISETRPDGASVEVVVADDASSDETPKVVSQWEESFESLLLVKKQENSGFVDTCNAGAEASSGDILVFLNNDTIAMPNWLTPLAVTLRDHPEIGVAGGKLIYGDGRLQEAGGVIFSNGGGANVGRSSPIPDAPLYSFLRDVHYCSGALLATPRELFCRLDGFDTHFRPAYYEDTDYCFRVARQELRVVLQPESAIVHLEGRTAGTSTAGAGMKRFQAINRERFKERWADVLSRHPEPPGTWDETTWHRLARLGPARVSP